MFLCFRAVHAWWSVLAGYPVDILLDCTTLVLIIFSVAHPGLLWFDGASFGLPVFSFFIVWMRGDDI